MRTLLLLAITTASLAGGLAVPASGQSIAAAVLPGGTSLVATQQQSAPESVSPVRLAAYEWRPLSGTDPDVLSDSIAAFSLAGGNEILLDISEVADLVESGDRAGLDTYRQRLDQYLASADTAGVAVGALAGSPHWISPGARYVTDILLDFVLDYNAGAPGPRLTSLQFDLEPWATPAWSKKRSTLTTQLLATVEHVSQAAAGALDGERIPIAFTLPFWLDGTAAPRSVRYNGQRMSPTAHVMRLLDTAGNPGNAVAVMAYRDHTDGSNGSIALLADEFALADVYQGRVGVIVAQEISPVEPTTITFHEEGWDALTAAKGELTAEYGHRAPFAGFAVNDLRSIAAAR